MKLRKPLIDIAKKENVEKTKKPMTQTRLNTIIKNVIKNNPELKKLNDEEDEYGNDSQDFLNKTGYIFQKVLRNKLDTLDEDEIKWIYNNLIN